MTVRSADGTREVAVPRILRERFALDDASVRAAAELALRRLSQSLLLDQGRDASALFVACAVAASLAAALSPLLEDRPAPDPVAA